MRPLRASALVGLFFAACGTTAPSATSDAGTSTDAGVTDDATAIDAGADGTPPPPPTPVCSEAIARAAPVKLSVEPDDGETPYVASLTAATKSIHLIVYELESGAILTTLLAKAKAGLDVRIILDLSEQSNNQSAFDALTAAGAKVIWSDPQFTFMHAKCFVVDGREAMISTGNFSLSQMKSERNYAVVDDDPADVAALLGVIDADLARATPDLSCTRLLVSPVNSKPRILSLIAAATKTLMIESMEFADSDVRAAVVARKNAGVDVRVLIADTSFVSANADAENFLTAAGVVGRTLRHPDVHVKSIIVDGTRAYLGSENLSYTSLAHNREVGIELLASNGEDIATMMQTFETDWAKATPNPPLPSDDGGAIDGASGDIDGASGDIDGASGDIDGASDASDASDGGA